MSAPRPRLFLIDGYSNIFRAFYAIRNLSNSRGEPTNAVYGFVQMLRKLLRDEKPELVGVALDVGGETVRSERYEAYKATRKPMPEDLRPQIPLIRRAIEAYRIPILELERYEADDVLGTMAAKAAAAGYEVVLVSADKDLMQLVGDHVSLYHTRREKLYDAAGVEEDFGVPPGQVVDVLALMGDASDNVPGVRGIGKVGALRLIERFGSVESLLERSAEVTAKKQRAALEEHGDDARMSKELVTIHTDLDIAFDAASLEHEPPDSAGLRELFLELEFFSLAEELDTTQQSGIDAAVEIGSVGEWERMVERLGTRLFVAIIGVGRPIGLAVGDEKGDIWLADFRQRGLRQAVTAGVAAWLADESRELVGHDLKEVLRLVSPARLSASFFDTMLASFVERPDQRSHALPEVALAQLQYKMLGEKEVGWSGGDEPAQSSDALLAYAAEQVELARRLETKLRADLDGTGRDKVYREIELPLLPVVVAMEEHGILLDSEFLAEMSREITADLMALESKIYSLAGDRFNINSPRQLGEVLFEQLGYPIVKRTRKTKSYSTDSDTLQELVNRGYDLPGHILKYRELAKLKSTYVDALPQLVDDTGRLHTRYNQAGAATGRLSSSNPNLQNIPVRTELGQRIRRAFVAPDGYELLVADYNQIELRVLAHIAEDEALIAAFRSGEDIHRTTAAAVFDVAVDLVTAEQRRAAKVINFGIIYGMSAFGLARNLGIQQSDAARFIEAYLDRYEGVRLYMDATLATVGDTGRVETLYGRVRYLPDIHSKNRNLRENAKRMAINARIQGTAADLLKRAMVRVERRLREAAAHLLLTVHDELVLEVAAQQVKAVVEIVRAEMEGVETLLVPLVVDVGWGRTWYDAKVG